MLDLSDRGRVRELLAELARLSRETPALEPWIREVHMLTKSFRLKELRHSLQVDLDHQNSVN